MTDLPPKRVAILVADGFEQSHMVRARKVLEDAGALTYLICPTPLLVAGWCDHDYLESHVVDKLLRDACPYDYDFLLLPGGLISSDTLRRDAKAIALVQHFCETGKPIVAIGHGAQILVDAKVLRERTLTSAPSIRRDLENAGATWRNSIVVRDGNLLTAQDSKLLPEFNRRLMEHFSCESRPSLLSAVGSK